MNTADPAMTSSVIAAYARPRIHSFRLIRRTT